MNVTSPKPNEALLGLIEPFLYEFTAQHRGSISAEHGMGLLKASHMVRLSVVPCGASFHHSASPHDSHCSAAHKLFSISPNRQKVSL